MARASATTNSLRQSIASLTAQERGLLELLTSPNPIWAPLPGPQLEAYLSEADETFYGGSAGGGKTDLAIGLACTAHHRSRIFRREGTQLLGIIDRSKEIIGKRGHFRGGSPMLWRLGDGRVIELAGVKDEDDKKKFQGRPGDLLVFDEGTEFTPTQYRFLIGWNRTTRRGQRCRVLVTGNPPTTAEGRWVIEYWAPWLDEHHPNPAKPGELRWFAVIDGKDVEVPSGDPMPDPDNAGKWIQPRSRTFIPARLADNPFLVGTGYEAVLQGMPEPLRSQMLYGDFKAGITDDPWQVIPTEWVRLAQERWKARELGDKPPICDGDVGKCPTCRRGETRKGHQLPMTQAGMDVARGGNDKTTIAKRWGAWFAPLEKYPGTSTPDGPAAGALLLKVLALGGFGNIDGIGVGASVYDFCRTQRANVRAFIGSEKAEQRDRTGVLSFANLRAYAYWSLREALDPDKGDGLMLPPDPEVMADLCAPKWSMRTHGILVEEKQDIIKRLGRSPDCGDAIVYANVTNGALPMGWLRGDAEKALKR